MTRMQRTTLAAVAVFASAAALAGQEIWTPEGFENGAIYSLAVGPSGTRFAGTHEGVFQSVDPGIWTLIPGSPLNSTSIVPHPSDPDTLYTASSLSPHEGLYKTTDGGGLFQKLNRYAIGVHAVALDPAEPDTLYVGGEHPHVWKSTNGGSTWAAPVTPALVSRIRALVINPRSPRIVYAGSDAGDDSYSSGPYPPNAPVMRTVDSGVRWFAALRQFDHAQYPIYVTAMAIDSRSATLFAAAIEDPAGISLFRTSDGGVRWDRFLVGSMIAVGSIRALVVDPVVTNRIYAATEAGGVLRSDDGGATWFEINEGLTTRRVDSLVLDSANGQLLASNGQQIFRLRLDRRPSTCTPTTNRLCLLGGRYEVVVHGTDRRTGISATGVAIPEGDRFGSFSLPDVTGDSSLPEVFVKIVDAPPGPPVQVFYGGMTSLAYRMIVTDTHSGEIEVYGNDSGNRLCGGVDAEAFYDPEPEPDPGDACQGCWDYVLSKDASRPEQNFALALLGNRFLVTLSAFSARHGRTERGVAHAGTDRYGYFSLPGFTGSNTLPEVYVKMVDIGEVTGDFVLFHTGLTSADYVLTVTDQVTGAERKIRSSGDYCGGVAPLDGH